MKLIKDFNFFLNEVVAYKNILQEQLNQIAEDYNLVVTITEMLSDRDVKSFVIENESHLLNLNYDIYKNKFEIDEELKNYVEFIKKIKKYFVKENKILIKLYKRREKLINKIQKNIFSYFPSDFCIFIHFIDSSFVSEKEILQISIFDKNQKYYEVLYFFKNSRIEVNDNLYNNKELLYKIKKFFLTKNNN